MKILKDLKYLIMLTAVAVVLLATVILTGCDGEFAAQYEFDDFVVRAETGDETIGGASTRLLDKEDNRVHNIALVVDKLNGTIIQPGDKFSFNDSVGERSEERGFREATALFGKEKIRAFGGGVCQVSTTIYQAARNAGLEIEERHQHKKKIPYAEVGEDATVDFAADFDLVFENSTDRPIEIIVSRDEDHVHVTIDKV